MCKDQAAEIDVERIPRALFEYLSTLEINDQLDDSLYNMDRESWKLETVMNNSEERRYIAEFSCDQPSGHVKSEMVHLQS
jgi:hypothetical protein